MEVGSDPEGTHFTDSEFPSNLKRVKSMELHYRGAAYETSEIPVQMVEGEVIGHYRGATLRRQQPRHVTVQQPSLRVKYRGAWT
jgi:hypothetical protein